MITGAIPSHATLELAADTGQTLYATEGAGNWGEHVTDAEYRGEQQ